MRQIQDIDIGIGDGQKTIRIKEGGLILIVRGAKKASRGPLLGVYDRYVSQGNLIFFRGKRWRLMQPIKIEGKIRARVGYETDPKSIMAHQIKQAVVGRDQIVAYCRKNKLGVHCYWISMLEEPCEELNSAKTFSYIP